MDYDSSWVDGDTYVQERSIEHRRDMKFQYQLTGWFYLATGACGAAWAMWDSRWWLVGFIVLLALNVTRSVEMAYGESRYLMQVLDNRARIIEARTSRMGFMVDRIEKANRTKQDF